MYLWQVSHAINAFLEIKFKWIGALFLSFPVIAIYLVKISFHISTVTSKYCDIAR